MHERLSKLNDLNKATAALPHLESITRGEIRHTKINNNDFSEDINQDMCVDSPPNPYGNFQLQ